MKTYNVLWIDDEPEKQDGFSELAELNGIMLNSFKTSSSGMKELESHLFQYDAVVLDAKVFNESEDEVAKLTGLMNSISRIKELSSKRVVPYFIFSGQLDVIGNDTLTELLGNMPIYRKSIDNHKLFTEIKIAADQLIETQIKHKYSGAFEICIDHYIGLSAEKLLMQSLLIIEDGMETISSDDSFTDLRKIFELLFNKLNQLNIIPDGLFKGKGWMNGCSRYLNRESSDYILNDGVIHPMASHMQKIILNILQDASHEIPEKLNLMVGQFISQIKTSNLFKSIVYQILDLLIYFRHFIDEHPDPEKNGLLWKEITTSNTYPDTQSWIKGSVIRIAVNGFGTFQPDVGCETLSIPPFMIKELKLTEGDNIEITSTFEKTKGKTFVNQLRKL